MTEGKITLDGLDIREVAQHDLREKLGYVPQKGVLFSGTIASNIMFGNPDGSDEEMKEAAQIAQATEFIETKRKRYDSSIAQGGSNVSGGQKQRLSIARAIAKHPKLFIFDDSFSALDFKTDVALRRALREKTADSTVFDSWHSGSARSCMRNRFLYWTTDRSSEKARMRNYFGIVRFISRLRRHSFQKRN